MFKNLFLNNLRQYWKKTKPNFGFYDVVTPGNVSKSQPIPPTITCPQYYKNGVPSCPDAIEIKTPEQQEKMRKSCKLASKILHEASRHLRVGLTTDQLDIIIHGLCVENNAFPSPLNYRGFPKSVCTSVNNVACHGIPDDRSLQDGDIINIDITVYFDGFHGDCSKTFPVGNVDKEGLNLIKTTELILQEAVDLCRPGVQFCAIGNYIEFRAGKLGYTVIPSLVGHGIGNFFHGPPDIYHCANNYPGRMKPGMTFTIEPALTQGSEDIVVLEDGWTAVTVDNARSAQCEHTILIVEDGVEILTLPPEKYVAKNTSQK